ncbi:MAG: hypothetical protein IIB87_00830 [Chloroflexi bacterium]|nr:hypothetical protein [Chloroflexota bacterium]
MANRFLGLRHHSVIGRHHQHGDVGHIGAACPHFGECFVAGRIDKRNTAAFFFDLVGADVLCNAAAFAAHHVDADDAIKQGGLAVIDVTEKRHHRRARL